MGRHRPSITLNHKEEASLDNKKSFLACAHFVHKVALLKFVVMLALLVNFILWQILKKQQAQKLQKQLLKFYEMGEQAKQAKQRRVAL